MHAEGALACLQVRGALDRSDRVVGSAAEAAAAVIVIVRLTGRNRFSETAERRAQKWVAASFFLLAPSILYEAIAKLVIGSEPGRSWLAVGQELWRTASCARFWTGCESTRSGGAA